MMEYSFVQPSCGSSGLRCESLPPPANYNSNQWCGIEQVLESWSVLFWSRLEFSKGNSAFAAAEPQCYGGSPRIYSGEERFSAGHFFRSPSHDPCYFDFCALAVWAGMSSDFFQPAPGLYSFIALATISVFAPRSFS